MLQRKHVLILGAGSSVDYDFPTGIELCNQVYGQLNENSPACNLFTGSMGFTSLEISTFREALFYSGKDSVDQFLEHRPEYVPVGKAAIAFALAAKEQPTDLLPLNAPAFG